MHPRQIDPARSLSREAIRRHRVVPTLVSVAVVASVAASVGPKPPDALAKHGDLRPNILVIVTDDQRLDTMEVMPQTQKWFQRRGTTFANGFVTTPLCCPSRATIFTGRYAHNHKVRTNGDAEELNHGTTIQRYLDGAGYRTAFAGKFMNGWKIKEDPPYFDRWALMRGGYYERKVNVDGKVGMNFSYSTTWVRKKGVQFLDWFEKRDKRPWLLFLSPFAPHGPFTPAKKYKGATVPPWEPGPAVGEEDRSDKPEWVQAHNATEEGSSEVRAKQLRTLMSVDDLVGKVMKKLGRLGERSRTLAFFISDNGYFWSEHGLSGKRHPYTENLQVPFMARWPGHLVPGAEVERPALNVDLVPTIVEAARVDPAKLKAPLDGRSLLSDVVRDHLLFEVWDNPKGPYVPTWASIRTARAQYVEYYDDDGEVIFREYYDLSTDPWQLDNLLGDDDPVNDPVDIVPLAAQLAADRGCWGTTGPSACP